MLQSVDVHNYYVPIFNKLCSSFFFQLVYVSVCKRNHVCVHEGQGRVSVWVRCPITLCLFSAGRLFTKFGARLAASKPQEKPPIIALSSTVIIGTRDPTRPCYMGFRDLNFNPFTCAICIIIHQPISPGLITKLFFTQLWNLNVSDLRTVALNAYGICSTLPQNILNLKILTRSSKS